MKFASNSSNGSAIAGGALRLIAIQTLREIYQGVDAVTDVLPGFLFEEILGSFPEGKLYYSIGISDC